MPTERVLEDFLGTWDIARTVTHDGAPPAQFTGQGTWTAVGDGATYAETGLLQVAGATPMRAERRYRWGPDLAVWFEDGRFFHAVPATGGRAEHWCDPDRYIVNYDFSAWPAFDVTWDVRGPRKDYRMVSRFTRSAGP